MTQPLSCKGQFLHLTMQMTQEGVWALLLRKEGDPEVDREAQPQFGSDAQIFSRDVSPNSTFTET